MYVTEILPKDKLHLQTYQRISVLGLKLSVTLKDMVDIEATFWLRQDASKILA